MLGVGVLQPERHDSATRCVLRGNCRFGFARQGRRLDMAFILWLIAAVLVIAGIVTAIRGQVVAGIALIIVGLLVGPGGVSIFA